ncbi:MAG: Lsr2 family protein [Mycobacteriales bacterium]
MAQKVQVLLVCDLHDDDEEGTETITFSLDGAAYEIDVCDAHGAELRDAFAPYVGSARRAGRAGAGSRRKTAPGKGGAGSPDRVVAIREWGRTHGHQVSERGRLSAALVAAYEAAH